MLKPWNLLVVILFMAIGVESFAQRIFWTERSNNRIMVANLTPTGISTPTTFKTGLTGPTDLAIDVSGGQLFYTDNYGEDIIAVNLNTGALISTVITTGAMVYFEDISFTENNYAILATMNPDVDGIYYIPADNADSGGESQPNMSGQNNDYYLGIATLDGFDQFFAISLDDEFIYRSDDYNGGNATAIVSLSGLEYIAVDHLNNKLFFTRVDGTFSNEIWTSNLDGSGLVQLADVGTGQMQSIVVYPQFGKLYFVKENDAIYSMNTDGTGLSVIQPLLGSGVSDIVIQADLTPPIFTTLAPADGATNIPVTDNLVLTFDESIKVSTESPGTTNEFSFRLYKTTGNVLVETFDRTSPNISFSGQTVTINPTSDLEYSTDYYVLAGNKVVSDLSNNEWIGISLATGWNFKTEVNTSIFYSRQSGSWDNVNTWSHEGHTGAVATTTPGGTGHQTFIGNGHTVTLSGPTFMWDINVAAGSTLDAASQQIDLNGAMNLAGTFTNGGDVASTMGFNISAATMPIFNKWSLGNVSFPSATFSINTDVVLLDGYDVIAGSLVTNGFGVYAPPLITSSSPASTSTDNSITLTWTRGSGAKVLVVMRPEVPGAKPAFGQAYSANTVFGSGSQTGTDNFVVYNGTGTTVTVTGLTPSTQYYFDLYEFYENVPTYGEIYATTNYQVWPAATCATLTPPANPVNAEYCSGSPVPAISVNDPGSGFTISWWDQTGTTPASGTPSGLNGEIFTPSAPGTYAAKRVEDATGCVSSTFTLATLTQHPTLVPGTASANQTVCAGGDPASITGGTATGGNGTYTYQWESASAVGGPYTSIATATGANYDPPTGIAATTHFRRVTTAFCSLPGNAVTITVTPQPAISLHPQPATVCETQPASFTVTATGASLTYQWEVDTGGGFGNVSNGGVYSGATSATLSISVATGLNNARYRVVVMSGGACPVTSNSALLTVNASPVAVNQPQTVCEGTPGSGTATINLNALNNGITGGAASRSVSWFTNAGLTAPVADANAATASNGTTFYARVTNTVTSCANSASAVITVNSKPAVTTSPSPVTICSGTATNISLTSSIAGTTYSWTVTANPSVTGASGGSGNTIAQTLNNTSALQQTITYVVTPTAGTCVGNTFSKNVVVDFLPTAFSMTGGGTMCEGESGLNIGLSNSQPGVDYELFRNGVTTGVVETPGGGAFNFSGLFSVAGTYTARARSSSGCTANMTGSANIVVSLLPAGTGSISGGLQLCIGATSTYKVSGITNATSYVWTLPAGMAKVTPADNDNTIDVVIESGTGGFIKVQGQNGCGFSDEFSFQVGVIPSPVVQIVLPENVFATEPASFAYTTQATVDQVNWNFGAGGSSTDDAPVVTFPEGGTYEITLVVTDVLGCTGEDVATLEVKPKAELGDLAIKNVITANGDGSNDVLFIENIEKFVDNEVVVLDRWGAEVFRKKGYQNDWDARLGDKYIPSGNYVCVVRFEGKVFSRTITVIKEQ